MGREQTEAQQGNPFSLFQHTELTAGPNARQEAGPGQASREEATQTQEEDAEVAEFNASVGKCKRPEAKPGREMCTLTRDELQE